MNSAILTISINGNDRVEYRPGDTDPIIASYLSKYTASLLQIWAPLSRGWLAARDLAEFLHSRAIGMVRGGDRTWWAGLLDPGVESPSDGESETADTATSRDAHDSIKKEDDDPQNPKDPGDMTYQCDSSLGGAPDPTDCEKLSWAGLKPPDSVETLQANVPKFYSQGLSLLSPYDFSRKEKAFISLPS